MVFAYNSYVTLTTEPAKAQNLRYSIPDTTCYASFREFDRLFFQSQSLTLLPINTTFDPSLIVLCFVWQLSSLL